MISYICVSIAISHQLLQTHSVEVDGSVEPLGQFLLVKSAEPAEVTKAGGTVTGGFSRSRLSVKL